MSRFLPYGRQTIDEEDIAAVAQALRSDFLTTGARVAEFEQAFATATGATHAVACNSGTAALHLAALALDLGPGDVAIVPTMTFLATANAVRMTGAEVVFADVDPQSGLLTPETFAQACAQATAAGRTLKAALPVHLNGQLCDLPGLAAIARDRGIALIEDACHALGTPAVGATHHSRMACFSTHPVKAVATGEGGLVTTADAVLADRMRRLRNHGINRAPEDLEHRALAFDGEVRDPHYYEMPELGWNYRIPDILCALGISQLGKLERFWRRRCEIAALYDRLLTPLALRIKPVPGRGRPHGWHLYAVLIDFAGLGLRRGRVMTALAAEGIGTQVHYIPVHRQPYYRHRYGDLALPGAEAYYARCLSIPIFPSMTDTDVARVVEALARIVGSRP